MEVISDLSSLPARAVQRGHRKRIPTFCTCRLVRDVVGVVAAHLRQFRWRARGGVVCRAHVLVAPAGAGRRRAASGPAASCVPTLRTLNTSMPFSLKRATTAFLAARMCSASLCRYPVICGAGGRAGGAFVGGAKRGGGWQLASAAHAHRPRPSTPNLGLLTQLEQAQAQAART